MLLHLNHFSIMDTFSIIITYLHFCSILSDPVDIKIHKTVVYKQLQVILTCLVIYIPWIIVKITSISYGMHILTSLPENSTTLQHKHLPLENTSFRILNGDFQHDSCLKYQCTVCVVYILHNVKLSKPYIC